MRLAKKISEQPQHLGHHRLRGTSEDTGLVSRTGPGYRAAAASTIAGEGSGLSSIARTIDRVSSRSWTDQERLQILGPVRNAALAHASDDSLRASAASGGAVTAILSSAMKARHIDAALVCSTEVESNRVRATFRLARTSAELRAAQGSKYVAVNFVRDAVPLLREFGGRVAVVGLPCDLSTLKRLQSTSSSAFRADVALTIGLFCGHNSRPELVDLVTHRLAERHGSDVVDFQFKTGHWRGNLSYTLADGTVGAAPSRMLNSYRHLSLFSERKCLSCADHFAYDADIGAGDVWLYRLRHDPVKHTGLLARTDSGEQAIELARSSGELVVKDVDPVILLDGQARIAPHHHNVDARRRAGRVLGVRIAKRSVPAGQRSSFLARVDGFLTVAAFRITDSRRGRQLVDAMPHRIIRLLAGMKKALMVVVR